MADTEPSTRVPAVWSCAFPSTKPGPAWKDPEYLTWFYHPDMPTLRWGRSGVPRVYGGPPAQFAGQ